MRIELERRSDPDAIAAVTTAAFAEAPHSAGTEARVIAALRQADALTVSLVALNDADEVTGHIAFSPVLIESKAGPWYGLGPVSVLPPLQGVGIGSALILAGLDRLRDLGAELCVLLGNPAYYARFGFTSGGGLTYLNYPVNPNFQWLLIAGDRPHGDVIYHPAFDIT